MAPPRAWAAFHFLALGVSFSSQPQSCYHKWEGMWSWRWRGLATVLRVDLCLVERDGIGQW